MMVRLLTCGRPVCHDGFRLVADFEHLGDRLLLLLVCADCVIEGFDARKAFYDILKDAVDFGNGLLVLVQCDEAKVQDLFAHSTIPFPVHSEVDFFRLVVPCLGRIHLLVERMQVQVGRSVQEEGLKVPRFERRQVFLRLEGLGLSNRLAGGVRGRPLHRR